MIRVWLSAILRNPVTKSVGGLLAALFRVEDGSDAPSKKRPTLNRLLDHLNAAGNPRCGYFSTADGEEDARDAFPPKVFTSSSSSRAAAQGFSLAAWSVQPSENQWRVPARGSNINKSILICAAKIENSAANPHHH